MRILAVDDDPVVLDLLDEVLSTLGYEDVKFAASGQEGLSILRNDKAGFDVLLFDIQMPDMDGISLTKWTRQITRYRDAPILMLTAMSDKSYIDGAFQAGATDYITKPFEIYELRTRMTVASRLAYDQQIQTGISDAVRVVQPQDRQIALEDAHPIQDIDQMLPLPVFHNYLKQLGRRSLFTSSLMALRITNIERLYGSMTDYEYICALTDAADAITSAMPFRQFFMTHMGNGNFICVGEGIYHEQMAQLPTDIAHRLEEMEPCYGDGRPLIMNVVAGDAVPLRFRGIDSIRRAMIEASAKVQTAPQYSGTFGQFKRKKPLFGLGAFQ